MHRHRFWIFSLLTLLALLSGYFIWLQLADPRLIYTVTSPVALTSVAFSSNLQLLVTGNTAGQVELRRTQDGAVIQASDLQQGDVSAVAFTPDGQHILSVGVDGAAWVWNVTTAAPPRILLRQPLDPVHAFRVTMADGTHQIGTEKFTSVAMSPDRQVVAIGTNENRILLVQEATGVIRHVFQGAVQGIFAPEIVELVFSPDGQFLASKEALAGVSLWDIRQQRLVHAFNGPDPSVQSQVFSMAFSANQATLFLAVHSTGLSDRWVLPNGPYQIAANDQHVNETVGVEGNAHVVSAEMSRDGTLTALSGGDVV